MIIKDNFTDSRGQTYNIRNIHFPNFEDVYGNLGTFVTESHRYANVFSDYTEDGIYLYKSSYDPKRALRIYKDFHHYKYIGHSDERLITKLHEKQPDIRLTEFPTGIITIENKVVGQEIPYYENYETIRNVFENKSNNKIPTYYYIEILKIIKELYECGIVYQDIHTKNLLFNIYDETIKLIDFEPFNVKFDDDRKYGYASMISNLKQLINVLNELSSIEFTSDFKKTNTLEEVEECILENHLRLK